MFAQKKYLLLVLASAACAEPYTTPVNENADPVVEEVFMRDGVESPALATVEGAALDYSFTEHPQVVFPSQYPLVRFNKLIDGDTLETTEEDVLTKRALGQCGLVDGALSLIEGSDTIPSANILACYSPSDRMVSVRPGDAGTPSEFLKYETDYQISLTKKILDKKGRALAPTTVSFKTRAFELLSVTGTQDPDGSPMYGAPGTAFEQGAPDAIGTDQAKTLRLLFSGPMVDAPAISSLLKVKVFKVAADGGKTELQATDAKGAVIVSLVSSKTASGKSASPDPRVVTIFPPDYIKSVGKTGFAAGDYELQIPATVSDDGTVTGAAVTIKAPITIPFTLSEPAR